jgi:lysophospholipase L1-like esterase
LDSTNTTVSGHTTKLATHDTTLASHETELESHASQLPKKANQIDLDSTNETVTNHTAKLELHETEINSKAEKVYVDTQISTIGNASPKGTYATLSDLQSAFPTGTTGIYVVTADGCWYYWNSQTTSWTSGGTYQSTKIAEGTVVIPTLEPSISNNFSAKYNKSKLLSTDDSSIDYSKYVSFQDYCGYAYRLDTSNLTTIRGFEFKTYVKIKTSNSNNLYSLEMTIRDGNNFDNILKTITKTVNIVADYNTYYKLFYESFETYLNVGSYANIYVSIRFINNDVGCGVINDNTTYPSSSLLSSSTTYTNKYYNGSAWVNVQSSQYNCYNCDVRLLTDINILLPSSIIRGHVYDSGAINIDTTAKTITNTSVSIFLESGEHLTIPASTVSYTIGFTSGWSFNNKNKYVRSLFISKANLVFYVAYYPTSPNDILLCSFDDSKIYNCICNDKVKINNISMGNNRIIDEQILGMDYSKLTTLPSKAMIRGFIYDSGAINIDTSAKTITNTSATILIPGGEGVTVPASTVSYTLSFYSSSMARSLFVSKINKTFYVANTPTDSKDILICSFDDTKIYNCICNDRVTINGIKRGNNLILDEEIKSLSYSKLIGVPSSDVQGILYTLHDAFVAWMNGDKFPIVFAGDSTTDGYQTTNYVANVIGTDHTSPYLYTQLLENYLKEEISSNTSLRIYNSGFSGKTLAWFIDNFNSEIINNTYYSDAKMLAISFGINDRIDTEAEYETFITNLETLINMCYTAGIQPFLLTSQHQSEHSTTYTRQSWWMDSYANKAKHEVAKKYNLEIIDVAKFTEDFVKYSSYGGSVISTDKVHFGDIGHKYEAGMFFSHIIPRTIWISQADSIGFANQEIKTDLIADDTSGTQIVGLTTRSNGFAYRAKATRTATDDVVMLDAWVFIDSKNQLTLTTYVETVGTQYIVIDGVSTAITSQSQTIGTLDLGLHHIKVMSGNSTNLDFIGIKLA